MAPIDPADLPPAFSEPGWTTLRIPLEPGTLKSTDVEAWLDRWDDSALLFLRHVARVTLFSPNGGSIRELTLSRRQDEDSALGADPAAVSREFVESADGRSWAVYSVDVTAPNRASRALKATGSTTPIAVALPLGRPEGGQIYAGLPVAPARSPLFANAQFDPLTNRADFADTTWNDALVSLVAELWSEAVLDLFARDPQAAWHAIPLPNARDEEAASRVIRALEDAVVENARRVVASRLSFPLPEEGHVSLSRLAVEAQPLEKILKEAETAELSGLGATLPIGVRDTAGRWRSVLDDWRSHGTDLPEPVGVERALELLGDEGRPVGSTIALVAAALQEGLDATLLKLPCVIARDGRRLVPPAGAAASAVSAATAPLAEQLGLVTRLHPAHLARTDNAPEVLAWLRECGALLDASDDSEVVRRLAKTGQSGTLPSLTAYR